MKKVANFLGNVGSKVANSVSKFMSIQKDSTYEKELLKKAIGMSITFEGGEGVGKGTIIEMFVNKLKELNFVDYFSTREPGGDPIAEQIRNVIVDKKNTDMTSECEALLYAGARAQHLIHKVFPLLEKSFVIFDRFVDSSLVYQGMARGLGVDSVWAINLFATRGWMPDMTFVLDLDPEVGQARIKANKDREVNRLDLEKMDFHNKVRAGYLELAEKHSNRIVVIDASGTPEEVFQLVWNSFIQKLEERESFESLETVEN